MAEISRPWTGIITGDAGPYSAGQWTDLEKYSKGIYDLETGGGPLIGSGTPPDRGLTVQAQSPAASGVTLTIGAALVDGTYYRNSADLNLLVSPNVSGSTRIDTLVLRKDVAAQTVRAVVVPGTPGSGVPPTLTQTAATWETPIADITLLNGFVTVANTDIMPRMRFVNTSNGIYLVNIKNTSGGALQTGDVVVWDIAASGGVGALPGVTTTNSTLSNTAYYPSQNVAGVWTGYTASNGYGKILFYGIGYVRVTGSVSLGQALITSQTVKLAVQSVSFQRPFAFATCLDTANFGASNGLILAMVRGTLPDWRITQLAASMGGVAGSALTANAYDYNSTFFDNGANFTTTSASFVALTNVCIALASNGPIMAGFSGVCSHSVANNYINFDLQIGGVNMSAALSMGDGLTAVRPVTAGANGATPFSWQGIINPGRLLGGFAVPKIGSVSYNLIQLMWKTQAATATLYSGAGTTGSDVPITLWAYALPIGTA